MTTRQDANLLLGRCRSSFDGAQIIPVRAESKHIGWAGRSRMIAAIKYGIKHGLFRGYESHPGWWVIWDEATRIQQSTGRTQDPLTEDW